MGDTDISRAFQTGGAQSTRVSAGLVAGYTTFYNVYNGTEKVSSQFKEDLFNTTEFELRLALLSAMVSVDLPSGTGLSVILPMGRAAATRWDDSKDSDDPAPSEMRDASGNWFMDTVDYGIGDMEIRSRQSLRQLLPFESKYIPQMVVSLGVAAPTGEYVVKPTIVTEKTIVEAADRYVSLGRGIWWGLADLEVYGAVSQRIAYYLSLNTRTALTNITKDLGDRLYKFDWGQELRYAAGVNVAVMPGLLNASLAADWQHRAESLEEDQPFLNGGGDWYSFNPMVQVILPEGFSLAGTLRVPIHRNVNGHQVVPEMSWFFSMNYSWSAAPPKPKPSVEVGEAPKEELIAKLLVPGKITIVDYWATWCGPCKKLAPIVEAYADGRDDVVLKKVDATEWEAPEMGRYLPAVSGLPVLDIYGPDGRLIRRIDGSECFDFAKHVPAAK